MPEQAARAGRLVERLTRAADPVRPAREPSSGWDWVSSAARRPGSTAGSVRAALAALPEAVALETTDGLVRVRVSDAALVGTLDEPLPGPAPRAPVAASVPEAFATASGRSVGRFAARHLDNPAYAAVLVADRTRRGRAVSPQRRLLVLLADLPRVLAAVDTGRPHPLVDWLGATAAVVVAGTTPRPGATSDVVPGCDPQAVGARVAATTDLALRRLGVPDIERV